METPDHTKKIFYLLVAGGLVVTLLGGLTGIAKRYSAVPGEALLLNLTSNELSLDFPITKLQRAFGSMEPWQDKVWVILSIQGASIPPMAAPQQD